MKDEIRGAITIVVVLAAYFGAIGIRRASREPSGKVITGALAALAGAREKVLSRTARAAPTSVRTDFRRVMVTSLR